MKPDEVRERLTEQERIEYDGALGYASVHPAMDETCLTSFAKSLAQSRAKIAKKNRIIDSLIETIDRLVEKLKGLKSAQADLAEARAMLEKHQWCASSSTSTQRLLCPECSGRELVSGHAPDCRLAKIVKEGK